MIKSYLWNSSRQYRFKYLSLIANENESVSKLDLTELLNAFVNIKARKIMYILLVMH